jgi:DNA (cytosine-5)-methyltransferase 1
MTSLELFTGAGGLALGLARSGFEHLLVVERDSDSCATLNENKRRGVRHFSHWPIVNADVQTVDYQQISRAVTVIAGGPPCQPFSLGGKHKGHMDERNMFPEAVRAVRELKPMAFVFENVKGLLRESFATYFEYIKLQLRHPTLVRGTEESWQDHRARLEKHHTGGKYDPLHYKVIASLLNAADYGVPQKRERVFIVGIRADLGIEWSFPLATHSHESLLWDQWISGEYWERHGIRKRVSLLGTRVKQPRIENLREREEKPRLKPWRTVRDALVGLPDPITTRRSDFHNHVHNPGARSYPGHTGSDYDESSKVLKAGDHGVPGGENTLALPNGEVRYFTVRECARIQTFPDEMIFPTSWTESMRQIGNAVPVSLAELIGKQLRKALAARFKDANG